MPAPATQRLLQAYLIAQWIFLSSTIIVFNKYILSSTGFHYPLTLVMMHMLFITICTRIWSSLGWEDVPSVSRADLVNSFVPVGATFAASLALGNAAYLYISVAFVQMLKASTPVAVMLASFAFGLEKPTWRLAVTMVVMSSGVALSCSAQIDASAFGTVIQMVAVGCEALRLCLVNMLLSSKGLKFSPISSLYYIAPICFGALFLPWLFMEARLVAMHRFGPIRRVGPLLLLANASVAFLLNLATMALIKHTSALTLNVSGVFKDILLILWSVAISGALVTLPQYLGYTIALVGVIAYSKIKRDSQRTEAVRPSREETAELKADLQDPATPCKSSSNASVVDAKEADEQVPLNAAKK